MTTLVVNGRFLSQPITGVQRFAIEICKHLVVLAPQLLIVVPKGTSCLHDELKPNLRFHGNRSGTLWEQIDLVSFMKEHKGFLLNLCNTAPVRYDRNIVTIHDLGVYVNRAWYKQSFVRWYRFLTPRIIKKAKAILTVSQFSKNEIQRIFNVGGHEVHVVYNGTSEGLNAAGKVNREKQVLHVGTFSERKNVNFIIEAFQNAKMDGYRLVLCGHSDSNLSYKIADLSSAENIEFKTGVTDEELNQLYSKSRYIVCASHYEGFGLPILEGISHGLTPILSDIPVFRELYDKGSLFFHPEKLNELTDVFSNLPDAFNCPSGELICMYKEKFNYESSARTIIKLLNSL